MARDHQLLVSPNDPGGYSTLWVANSRTVVLIRVVVKLYTEPRRLTTDSFADGGGVLADSPGEHD
jgi:hypothetical protein